MLSVTTKFYMKYPHWYRKYILLCLNMNFQKLHNSRQFYIKVHIH